MANPSWFPPQMRRRLSGGREQFLWVRVIVALPAGQQCMAITTRLHAEGYDVIYCLHLHEIDAVLAHTVIALLITDSNLLAERPLAVFTQQHPALPILWSGAPLVHFPDEVSRLTSPFTAAEVLTAVNRILHHNY